MIRALRVPSLRRPLAALPAIGLLLCALAACSPAEPQAPTGPQERIDRFTEAAAELFQDLRVLPVDDDGTAISVSARLPVGADRARAAAVLAEQLDPAAGDRARIEVEREHGPAGSLELIAPVERPADTLRTLFAVLDRAPARVASGYDTASDEDPSSAPLAVIEVLPAQGAEGGAEAFRGLLEAWGQRTLPERHLLEVSAGEFSLRAAAEAVPTSTALAARLLDSVPAATPLARLRIVDQPGPGRAPAVQLGLHPDTPPEQAQAQAARIDGLVVGHFAGAEHSLLVTLGEQTLVRRDPTSGA